MAKTQESQYVNTQDNWPADGGPYSGVEPAFAAPPLEEGYPYPDTANGNWAPVLERDGVDGTPDGQRLGTFPVRYYRPDGDKPPDTFWQQFEIPKQQREDSMLENLDADGWERQAPVTHKMGGRAGGEERPPDSRLTQKLSPGNWIYSRLFDQGQKGLGPRQFNGNHFSMADHRRTYPIHANTATRSRRNTYRLEPQPWDTDIVDRPMQPTYPEATYIDPNLQSGSRSWRL
jgi:hypothetical protein